MLARLNEIIIIYVIQFLFKYETFLNIVREEKEDYGNSVN